MIEFAPLNEERPLTRTSGNRAVATIISIDPPSVLTEESIFVNAVTTLGIPLVDFAEYREEIAPGQLRRKFVWHLETKSVDGLYTLKQLRAWWNDPQWLAKNPKHELAILHVGLGNLLRFATRVREQTWLLRLAEECDGGRLAVHIPSDATPEQREALLAQLR